MSAVDAAVCHSCDVTLVSLLRSNGMKFRTQIDFETCVLFCGTCLNIGHECKLTSSATLIVEVGFANV